MPPDDRIEDRLEGDNSPEGSDDNLGGERTVDGQSVKEAAGRNRNVFASMSDIPVLGTPAASPTKEGFCLTDGDQVIASKHVNQASKDAHIIEYKPEQVNKSTYSLGLDYEESPPPPSDTRNLLEKAGDFVDAATHRAVDFALDPKAQAQYASGLSEKIVGVGEGLNIAKEETKKAAAAAWTAVTDGSVAEFLARPNAINDPLFEAAGKALDAMAEDPNAVNHLLEAAGQALVKASNDYSHASPREQGHAIGQVTFAGINPEGSTEGAELALKGLNNAAGRVEGALTRAAESTAVGLEEAGASATERQAVKGVDLPAEDGKPLKGRAREGEGAFEKLTPSEEFTAELARIVDSLTPGEKAFLAEHGIEIKPVRRIIDAVPDRSPRTAGVYVPGDRTIYVAEEVMKFGRWSPSDDAAFIARHEFGHAFNAKAHPFGEWLSDSKGFREAFKKDMESLSPDLLDELMLSVKYKTPALARDEVLSDMYAHASGLVSNNAYSQKMKLAFPSCLAYMQEL